MINKIEEYNSIIDSIRTDINKTQLQIMLNANTSLVELYYRIGGHISINYTWGNKFVEYLSFSLRESFPNMKGFSERNLNYMKLFYEECQENVQFLHLGAKLPWKHNIALMEKVKDRIVRVWYMEKCIREGWTKQVLLYQIETNLYQRQVKNKKHNNFELTMKENSELASALMKDPYVFDIIELTSNFKERELENKMIEKLKSVLLEFGNGFSFVGNQYKITVDKQDFYIDLLFYQINLKCYVAIELKLGEFKPEYGSKMSFYLTALDEQIKSNNDNPSIGIILCQEKSNKIVDYTLKYINRPVGVSEYKTYNNYDLPKEILLEMPTENDLIIHLNDEK